MRSRTVPVRLAAALAVAALPLTACSGDEQDPGEGTAGASPTADGGSSSDAGDGSDGGVTTTDGDSEVATYSSVPPDFPGAVPLLDESEASGSVTRYEGLTSYSVVVESDEVDPGVSLSDAAALLSDAGFDGDAAVTGSENAPTPLVLSNEAEELLVVLSAVAVDGGSLLTYAVEVS